jgi:hypothetical protein
MAIQIKQLGIGTVNASSSVDPVGSAVASGKTRIVKSLRLVNAHASAAATINVYLNAGSDVLISPSNLSLGAGQVYVDDQEITMEATHKIKLVLGSGGGPVHYVVSGVERDV